MKLGVLMMNAFAVLIFGVTAFARPVGDKPNVVLIMSDDQGYGDVRLHGNLRIDTPNLDRLARDGARLDRFYVSPVCAPTRASLLTGRYHLRTRVSSTSLGHEVMRTEEVTLAEVLRANGYATGAFGKWHNGHHPPYHPNGQGFDEYVGVCQGHWNNYFNLLMERNGQPYPTRGFVTDVLTDHALGFIEANRDQPFLCYVPYNTPHSPFQLPDEYFDKYTAAGLDARLASVHGMVESIDHNVGRILDKLDELQLADNTIVIYLSDNGPNASRSAPRFNDYMKGAKGTVHEGGVRVPFFIRWPGRIAPGQIVTTIASHIDVLPTLVELTGTRMGETLPQDGISLVPLLNDNDEPTDWPRRRIFSAWTPRGDIADTSLSVRTPQFRAVLDRKGAKSGNAKWELYDMLADPNQLIDLATDRPEVLAELRAATEAWFSDVTRDGFDFLPAPIGLDNHPVINGRATVLLNAQDAQLESRDPTFPWEHKLGNNHWIDNWTSKSFTPWWHIDVLEEGEWDVALNFNATGDAVGTEMRVSVGNRAIGADIPMAFDSPPLPRPNRVELGGYVDKNWASLRMGKLRLRPGDTRLYVKAVTKTGHKVMQLKSVVLTKTD
ncbi:MAG: arylsulfatase [Planctomycetota bacterium]